MLIPHSMDFLLVGWLLLGLSEAVKIRGSHGRPTAHKESDDDSSQLASRSNIPYGVDGGIPSLEKPAWLIPLFTAGDGMANKLDGTMLGTAIRLTNFTLMANILSVLEMHESLRALRPKIAPKLLGFDQGMKFDLFRIRLDAYGFIPIFNITIRHNIAIYEVLRTSPPAEVEKPDETLSWLEQKFPLNKTETPPIPSKNFDQWGQHCFLQSWGANDPDNRMTLLNEITLQKLDKKKDCHDGLCTFRTWNEPGTSGSVCGKYSFLGAPIMCYQGKETRLSYIVSKASTFDGESNACTTEIKALDLSPHAEFIWEKAHEIDKLVSKNDFRYRVHY